MIILGTIVLIVGYVSGLAILVWVGYTMLAIGLVLTAVGAFGRNADSFRAADVGAARDVRRAPLPRTEARDSPPRPRRVPGPEPARPAEAQVGRPEPAQPPAGGAAGGGGRSRDWRRVLLAFATAACGTLLAVAVNVATGDGSSPLVWLAVVVLTAATAVLYLLSKGD